VQLLGPVDGTPSHTYQWRCMAFIWGDQANLYDSGGATTDDQAVFSGGGQRIQQRGQR
jgi:hypothetical protein